MSIPRDTNSRSPFNISAEEELRRSGANAPGVDSRIVLSTDISRPSEHRIKETAALASRLTLTSGTVHGNRSRMPISEVRDNFQKVDVPAGSPSTPETDEIGLLGEYFVYQLMSQELGPTLFGIQNWTSNLRSFIPGFPAFNGDAPTDFTYADRTGALTEMWYGEEMKQAWHGRWPTYHLEVKSTTGAIGEPFHVSQRQISAALKFTQRDLDCLPTDVFVLIRVSGLSTTGPNPSFAVFCDLHRCLYRGELHFASDVHMMAG
ncbi:hypothetical protein OF83DRAFT_1172518 [Amylostereum chailletii]|nr:hypothetical protein OF83DRAFT_1172518 [Amylostereum chailletii]